jgi:hypothetical protein
MGKRNISKRVHEVCRDMGHQQYTIRGAFHLFVKNSGRNYEGLKIQIADNVDHIAQHSR